MNVKKRNEKNCAAKKKLNMIPGKSLIKQIVFVGCPDKKQRRNTHVISILCEDVDRFNKETPKNKAIWSASTFKHLYVW